MSNNNQQQYDPRQCVGLADIFPLLRDHKAMFLQDGIVVVNNILSEDEKHSKTRFAQYNLEPWCRP